MEVDFNPFKYGGDYFKKPAEGIEKQKAEEIIQDVEKYKDELISLDNSEYDTARKRGEVEILGKQLRPDRNVTGSIDYDSYVDEKPVDRMTYSLTTRADENTIVYDDNTVMYEYFSMKNNEGTVETERFNKYTRGDGIQREVTRDVETGYLMYNERHYEK